MNNLLYILDTYKRSLLIIISAIFLFPISTGDVFATVGGPQYISNITYDSQNKVVYYLHHDEGGMGCPPILMKIDLITKSNVPIRSCQEFFEQSNLEWEEAYMENEKFIDDIIQGLPELSEINLEDININIETKTVSDEMLGGELWATNFESTIIQNDVEKAKINFTGCLPDQINNFKGYAIPDSDILLILVSRKSDCFEGGYLGEDIYTVNGIVFQVEDESNIAGAKILMILLILLGLIILIVVAISCILKNKTSNCKEKC